jgi:transcriptional regulator with XRE-family HTH domain
MNTSLLNQKTPAQIEAELVLRVRARRKEWHLSQRQLSERADVSLGSVKRFENSHKIALSSLIKIAIALDCEDDFEGLFARKHYRSIQEVIDERATASRATNLRS